MTESLRWIQRLEHVECPALTARRARRAAVDAQAAAPVVWARAEGEHVWDVEGRRFLDWTAGFGVAVAGHGHPALRAAIATQSERLLQALGDLHPADRKIELLERLAALAPFDDARGILGLSGADAVTAALKTAVLYTGRPGVLAFEGGYHGLSYGPLAACGYKEGFRRPFAEQLNPHVVFAPWPAPDARPEEAVAAVEAAWEASGIAAGAVLVEPIQGRGGVRIPPPGFLGALRDLAHGRGALLVVDEIFTGLGRTGSLWRSTADGVQPDVLCLGKALGGGLPISATLAPEPIMRAWGEPGGEALHTGTFFGHPLGCAAALATLRTLEAADLPARAARIGGWLLDALSTLASRRGLDARGAGLLLGIAGEGGFGLRAVAALRRRGHLALPAGSDASVLQLVPPLTIGEPACEALLGVLPDALDEAMEDAS